MQYTHYLGEKKGTRYYLIVPGATCEMIAAELRRPSVSMMHSIDGGWLMVFPDGKTRRTQYNGIPQEQRADAAVMYLRLFGRYPPDA